MMSLADWIGSAAATFTTTAFIPQAWKVWHTKHTADISLGMYAMFTLGVALWLVYGIILESWPIIAANSITLLLAGAVLAMKLNNHRLKPVGLNYGLKVRIRVA